MIFSELSSLKSQLPHPAPATTMPTFSLLELTLKTSKTTLHALAACGPTKLVHRKPHDPYDFSSRKGKQTQALGSLPTTRKPEATMG
jgi:hypothetical protein